MFEDNFETDIKPISSFIDDLKEQYDFSKSIYSLFLDRVNKTPDRVAVIYKDTDQAPISFTYRQLSLRVDLLAEELFNLLGTSGHRIGVYVHRSPYTLISMLAIWKTGNIYVPIDMAFPNEYISYIINDAEMECVITHSKYKNNFSDRDIICIEADRSLSDDIVNNFDSNWKHSDISDPGRLSFILYTSGSTGHPKGVLHRQYNLINRFNWFWNEFDINEEDVLLQRTNVNFIPSIMEFFIGLLKGCKTVIVSDHVVKDVWQLADTIEENKITVCQFVPSLLKRMIDTGDDICRKISSLRICVVCGEPLSLELYKEYTGKFPKCSMVNDYGSTETNGVLFFDSSKEIGKTSEDENKFPRLHTISNVNAYVLDDDNKPCDADQIGNLCFEGSFLAEGYINLPDETKKKFMIKNGSGRSLRVYNTGDLAEIDKNGGIRIVGREDQQVKIRGIRIELQAVENTIMTCDKIKECCVVAKKIREGSKVLVAFVVLHENAMMDEIQIRNMIAEMLPEYMVPSQIIKMDILPRTANGKVKRQELVEYNSYDTENADVNIQNETVTENDIIHKAAKILSRDPKDLSDEMSFRELGFDSLTTIDFINLINNSYNVKLRINDLFSNSNIKALTSLVNKLIANTKGSDKNQTFSNDNENKKSKIAVVGLSCRFAGAENKDEFWDNLVNGVSTVKEISSERWDTRKFYDPDIKAKGKYISNRSGMLENIDEFDGTFFRIVPAVCEKMDPQQRLCLEECYKALEDAGFSESELDHKKVGVYVGARDGDYRTLVGYDEIDASYAMGIDSAILAARISYYLNFKGAAITVDTACSSSMAAMHMAIRSIESGDSEIALVCGVNVMCTPLLLVQSTKMGILSPTGCIRTFDNNADGTVISEGIGVIVLKKLDDAIRDKDQIYGVIEGSGINQDGRSNGITAPNAEAQAELVRSVYYENNISPDDISYIECHGTGTKLGDPMEINALSNVFKNVNNKVAIGSVKPNIGHTFTCSGLAGIIKILLSMKNETIPPLANFNTLNEHMDSNMPFYINTEAEKWKAPRVTAINSFGLSGTNVHMVLSDYSNEAVDTEEQEYYLIPLSGKTKSAVERKKKQLIEWLRSDKCRYSAAQIAYTLQKGRSHFKNRVIYIVKEIDELISLLENSGIGEVVCTSKNAIDNDIRYKNILDISEKYIHGEDIDWIEFNKNSKITTISMPTYPFEKEHYWMTDKQSLADANENVVKHFELIGSAEADGSKRKYKVSISSDSELISGHKIDGKVIFPAAAIIEMVYEAVEDWGKTNFELDEVYLLKTIELSGTRSEIQLILEDKGDSLPFIINFDSQMCASGKMNRANNAEIPNKQDIDPIITKLNKHWSKEECYTKFRKFGLQYDGNYKGIDEIYASDSEALSFCRATRSEGYDTAFVIPHALDVILQAELGLVIDNDAEGKRLPYYIGSVKKYGDLPSEYVVHVEKNSTGVKITVLDKNGNIIITIDSFIVKMSAEKKGLNKQLICFKECLYPEKEEFVPFATDTKLLLLGKTGDIDAYFNSASEYVSERSINAIVLDKEFGSADHLCYVNNIEENDYHNACEKLGLNDLTALKVMFIFNMDNSNEDKTISNAELLAKELLIVSKCLANGEFGKKPEVEIVLEGSNSNLYMNAAAGFIRSLKFEVPYIKAKILVFDNNDPKQNSMTAIKEFSGLSNSIEVISYEENVRNKVSFEECDISKLPDDSNVTDNEGVTLITGGAGHLGLLTAKMVVRRFKGEVVLIGRRELDEEKIRYIKENIGSNVVYLQADICDRTSVNELIHYITSNYGNIRRIFYAAGVIKDKLVKNKTQQDLLDVIDPKIKGLMYLDGSTSDQPIELFVLYSSIASIIGNTGQTDYAFANGFMDSFVKTRNKRTASGICNGKTVSINWSMWDGDGMKVPKTMFEMLRDQFGLDSLSEYDGIDVLSKIIKKDISRCVVTIGDAVKLRNTLIPNCRQTNDLKNNSVYKAVIVEKLKEIVEDVTKIPMDRIDENEVFDNYGIDSIMLVELDKKLTDHLGELSQNAFLKNSTINEISDYLIESKIITGLDEENNIDENAENTEKDNSQIIKNSLSDVVKDVIEKVTKVPAGRIGEKDNFEEFGIDSIMLVEMEKQLSERLGESTQNVFFKYDNIYDIVGFLYEQNIGNSIISRSDANDASPDAEAEIYHYSDDNSDRSDEIVMIGMACKFPKANTVDEFWNNLKNGRNCIVKDENTGYYAGLIDGKDVFDPLFFRISPKDAAYITPEERLILEVAWQALEDSGYSRKKLHDLKQQGKRVGVFIGSMYENYKCLANDDKEKALLAGSSYWSIANRLSFFLDLNGPSIAIDSACSSSLTAVHIAMENLKNNECDLAIVGGVNLNLVRSKYEGLAQAHLIGTKPKSICLGMGDGYIPGEGVGVVILTKNKMAKADNDHIYCSIIDSVINHSGRNKAYKLPSKDAQIDLINRMFEKNSFDPRNISYYESAANGSVIGDAVEINGLVEAFGGKLKNSGRCAIGTVKSNIGHLEAASGISQLIKVALQMKYKKLVPSINAEILNPEIKLDDPAFFINREYNEWKPAFGSSRYAMIVSIGAGGSNVCVALKENEEEQTVSSDLQQRYLFVFSALTNERLLAVTKDFLDYLNSNIESSMTDISYTLARREPMAKKLAIIAGNKNELIEALKQYISQENDNMIIKKYAEDDTDNLEKIANSWLNGDDLELDLFNKGKLIPLPHYPFENSRFWIESEQSSYGSSFNYADEINDLSDDLDNQDLDDTLVTIVGKLLQIPKNRINLNESFENYGIDSLTLKKLFHHIKHIYNVNIGFDELYENYSIAGLKKVLLIKLNECEKINSEENETHDAIYYLDNFILTEIENNNMQIDKAIDLREKILYMLEKEQKDEL